MAAVTPTNIVQQIGNMNLGPITKSEPAAKTGIPEMIHYENDRPFVKFESDKDKVMQAVLENDPVALKLALNDPLDYAFINIPRANESPPMVVACRLGYINCVKVLLDVGADPLASDVDFQTGIHQASLNANMDVIECIFETAERDEKHTYHLANHLCSARRSPLHYAALADSGKDKVAVVTFLLNMGATPLLVDKKGELPSQLCADADTLKLLRFVERLNLTREEELRLVRLEQEERPNDVKDEHMSDAEDGEVGEPNSGSSPSKSEEPYEIIVNDNYIPYVIMKSHSDTVMEAVMDNNYVDLDTALEDPENVKIMDMNRDGQPGPPLVVACLHGYVQCVKVLLKFGADVLACDPFFDTAIHAASICANLDILELLFSTAEGDEPRAKLLANHHAIFGQTPLHYAAAAKSQSLEAVAFLLKKGACPLVRDRYMKLPSECCVDGRAQELLFMVERFYGKKD